MEVIEDLLCLSVADLRRLGFFRPGRSVIGPVNWRRGGEIIASVEVEICTGAAVPFMRLRYRADGQPVEYSTPLRFHASNLGRGGYYYFACPVTGLSCRKLYLYGTRFVSRPAFRGLYEFQAMSRAQRSGFRGWAAAMAKYELISGQRYRKYYYRDRLTPFGRRLERLDAKITRTLSVAAGV